MAADINGNTEKRGRAMFGSTVKMERRGKAAVITIQNPPVNVLTAQVRDELRECVLEAEADAEVKTVIFTGAGEKAFMAGADIKSFPEMCGVYGAAYGFAQTVYKVWDQIKQLPKPTIAAINGLTLGAGLELALVCDLRIAEEQAAFGFPEIALGLFPGGGGTQRMPRTVGMALAKEMIFTGKPIDSRRAMEAGLVNAVVPKGSGLQSALELAETIGSRSSKILALAKRAMNEGVSASPRAGISIEAELWQECFMTEDAREGVSAFLEKRAPRIRDR